MMLLDHLRIPTKMGIPAITSVLGMLAIVLLGGLVIREQSRLLDSLFTRSFAREAEVQALGDMLAGAHAALYRTMVMKTSNASARVIEEELQTLNDQLTRLTRKAEEIRLNLSDDPKEAAIFEQIGANAVAYQTSVTSFIDLLKVGVDPLDFLKELQRGYDQLNEDGRTFLAYQRTTAAASYGEVSHRVQIVAKAFLIIAGLALAVAIAVAMLVGRSISRPIRRLTAAMERLAAGDRSVDIPAHARRDEIGSMARTVQVFKENALRIEQLSTEQQCLKAEAERERHDAMHRMADSFEAAVTEVVTMLSATAEEMQSSAQSMSTTADQASQRSTTVAVASEQASHNVQTVASSASELLSSIQEIGRQAGQSANIAARAVDAARHTDATVRSLAEAAQRIGDVVKLINGIASQTNLLALNATIEAARAGEAGKGFAVVAGEVKNLAGQTAKATGDIASQVNSIQAVTTDAVGAIRDISDIIQQINDIARAMSSAIEEQDAATREIARNVHQAAAGTLEVSTNIADVRRAAGETGTTAARVLDAANEMTRGAALLRTQMEKFLVSVRAA